MPGRCARLLVAEQPVLARVRVERRHRDAHGGRFESRARKPREPVRRARDRARRDRARHVARAARCVVTSDGRRALASQNAITTSRAREAPLRGARCDRGTPRAPGAPERRDRVLADRPRRRARPHRRATRDRTPRRSTRAARRRPRATGARAALARARASSSAATSRRARRGSASSSADVARARAAAAIPRAAAARRSAPRRRRAARASPRTAPRRRPPPRARCRTDTRRSRRSRSPAFIACRRSPGRAQLVAGAAQRLERQRVAELRAQAPHVDVDRARAALVARPPHAREQHVAREARGRGSARGTTSSANSFAVSDTRRPSSVTSCARAIDHDARRSSVRSSVENSLLLPLELRGCARRAPRACTGAR